MAIGTIMTNEQPAETMIRLMVIGVSDVIATLAVAANIIVADPHNLVYRRRWRREYEVADL